LPRAGTFTKSKSSENQTINNQNLQAMNISDNTHRFTDNEAAPHAHSSRSDPAKTSADFNILNISNHHDKIVPKNMDFRNEFQFQGTADDMKALRGNILEMDSLHLAKKRHVPSTDKERLNSDGVDEEVDDFEEDIELFETSSTTQSKRVSSQKRTNINPIVEEDDKETTMQDFRQRVEDSLCVDSIHLNKKRLKESK
jgi:hypothetical protein